MDWKKRKDRLQTDENVSESEARPESVVAPESATETFDRPSSEDSKPFFFDIENDTFRTDSRRTAIDSYATPEWMSPLPASAPQWAPYPVDTPEEDAPSFLDATVNGYGNGFHTETASQAGLLEENGAGIELDAFAPYQPSVPKETEPIFGTPNFGTPQFEAPQFEPDPPPAHFDFSEYMKPKTPEPLTQPVLPPPSQALRSNVPPPTQQPEPPAPLSQITRPTQPPPRDLVSRFDQMPPTRISDRVDVASGLVSTDTDNGIPRVAPFIVDQPRLDAVVAEPEEHCLVLRMRNLSATFPLKKDVVTIGRPDAPTQNYPDIEIEMDDSVSRKHAEVRRIGKDFYIVDLGSTNGSMLNGQKLSPEKPLLLAHGDHIRVGERTEIIFE